MSKPEVIYINQYRAKHKGKWGIWSAFHTDHYRFYHNLSIFMAREDRKREIVSLKKKGVTAQGRTVKVILDTD